MRNLNIRKNPNAIVDTPQYPGLQKGMKREQVVEFVKDQVRRKGMKFTGGITSEDFKITLSGSARFLWGIVFMNDFAFVKLTINNEIVIEEVASGFLQIGKTEQDYFAVNRPLSGQDDITLTLTGYVGYQDQPVQFVYK